ncbi:MAG: phytanoyl-CoA dioxygenase family protein [Actinomycetota bacterium]|nr:phytanoyl-CoA dioxygenase family protein [Actinomycetota bacterium]
MITDLDPLNRDFSWRDHEGPFRLISEEQAARFDRLGYFLLEGVLEPERLAAVEEQIDRLEAEFEASLDPGARGITRAGEITFTAHIVTKSDIVKKFARSQPFPDLCTDLLGPDVRLYWDQAVYKKPETPREFPWHQDTGYVFTEPQDYLTCWVPLVNVSVENGCPWVAPNEHRQGTVRHRSSPLGWVCREDSEGAVPVEAKIGDIVVFSALTPHRTGPNVSPGTRKAYILQYAVDGTRVLRDGEGKEVDMLCNVPERQFLIAVQGESPAEPRA